MHSGDKRQIEKKCQYCEKVFKTYSNYKEHVMVKHEKNAKHKCDECHRSYGTNAKLQSHKKLVHERVKCGECGKKNLQFIYSQKTKSNCTRNQT